MNFCELDELKTVMVSNIISWITVASNTVPPLALTTRVMNDVEIAIEKKVRNSIKKKFTNIILQRKFETVHSVENVLFGSRLLRDSESDSPFIEVMSFFSSPVLETTPDNCFFGSIFDIDVSFMIYVL